MAKVIIEQILVPCGVTIGSFFPSLHILAFWFLHNHSQNLDCTHPNFVNYLYVSFFFLRSLRTFSSSASLSAALEVLAPGWPSRSLDLTRLPSMNDCGQPKGQPSAVQPRPRWDPNDKGLYPNEFKFKGFCGLYWTMQRSHMHLLLLYIKAKLASSLVGQEYLYTSSETLYTVKPINEADTLN